MATPSSVLVSWTAPAIGTPPLFYITNWRVDGDQDWIPNPLGLTQALSQPITGLAGATTYNIRVQVSNQAGVAFSAPVNFTTPFGATVLRDTSSPAEWGARTAIFYDAVVPVEFGNVTVISPSATRDARIGVEWTGPTGSSRDFIFGIDISATPLGVPLQVQGLVLSGATNTTITATWNDNATGPLPQGYQVQWRPTGSNQAFLSFIPTVPEPTNPRVVSQTFVVPTEFSGHTTVIRDAVVAAEWTGNKGATRDFTVGVEFGGNRILARDFVIPAEFSGSAHNVSRDTVVPVAWGALRRSDTLAGIEWSLTPTPTPTPTFFEIDLGDTTTVIDSFGVKWGLTQNSGGGVATQNDVINIESSYCDILVYVFATQTIWIQDQTTPGNWYFWTTDPAAVASGGFWTGPNADPRP